MYVKPLNIVILVYESNKFLFISVVVYHEDIGRWCCTLNVYDETVMKQELLKYFR